MKNVVGEDEIKGTLNHFIIASFDTTAGVLFCAMYCLAYHQEVQEKVYQEIMSVIDEGLDLNLEVLSECTYLQMVINETLRLFPPGAFVSRKASEEFTLSNGVTVPKDTNVSISIFHTHRNEKFWGQDSGKFNPENFSQENVMNRDPRAFVPFSKGLKSCPGLKNSYWVLKVSISNLLIA